MGVVVFLLTATQLERQKGNHPHAGWCSPAAAAGAANDASTLDLAGKGSHAFQQELDRSY
jgi:hypothetical protein